MNCVGLFHATLNAVAPLTAAWRATAPDVKLRHYVDEGLLAALQSHGLPRVQERLEHWVRLMHDDGADAVLLSCSSVTPLAPDLRRRLAKPVIGIDEAMIEAAVQCGRRISVLATLTSAARTTAALLHQAAGASGAALTVSTLVVPGAFDRLAQGDTVGHDTAVAEAAAATRDADAIVFAQVSMEGAARLCRGISVPLLTSGTSAVRRTLASCPAAP